MPTTFKTTFATEQDQAAYTRNARPSSRDTQQPVKYAVFSYTLDGAEADDDQIKLGGLGLAGAVVIPELSRVISTGSSDFDADLKLRRVNTSGTATDLTALAAIDNNTVAFARPTDPLGVSLAVDDYIDAFFDNTESTVAGDVLTFEIAYRCAQAAI